MAFISESDSNRRKEILLSNERMQNAQDDVTKTGGIGGIIAGSQQKELEARKMALLEQEREDKIDARNQENLNKSYKEQDDRDFKLGLANDERLFKKEQLAAQIAADKERNKLSSEDRRYMADAVGARNKENNATKVAINQNKPEKAPAQPSASEFQAATFYDRMNQAEKAFSSPNYTEASTSRGQQALGFLPGELQSEDYILGKQAERNFANAVLRKESGAAIGKEEFASAEKQYFPRPGDTEAVIAQKARNRQSVIQGLGREASRVVNQNASNFNQANSSQNKPIINLSLEEKKAQIRAMRAKGM